MNSSEAIRTFRRECGQTQVEFAVSIGMAPTTIHRYEAGSSVPDFPELKKLMDYALKRNNAKAQRAFMLILATRMGLDLTQIDDLSPALGDSDALSRLEIDGTPLDNEEKIKVVAFLLMLRHSTDNTHRNVVDAVLQPWCLPAKAIVDAATTVSGFPSNLLKRKK